MYYLLFVYIIKGRDHTGHKEFSLFLCKPFSLIYMISKVTPCQQIHTQIEIITILKGVVHVDNKWVFQFSQDLSFI